VKLDKVEIQNQQVVLHLSGIDLVDGTPVVDVKPYIPYADNVEGASNAWASGSPVLVEVIFSDVAENSLRQEKYIHLNLKQLIVEVLQQDPRPAYQNDYNRMYKMSLFKVDIEWLCRTEGEKNIIEVCQVK